MDSFVSYPMTNASINHINLLLARASTEPPHSTSTENREALNTFSGANFSDLLSATQISDQGLRSNKSSVSNTTIGALTEILRTSVLPPVLAYALPIALILNIVNNSLVLCVLAGSERVRRSLPATVRLYYLAMALNDVSNSLPMHLTYFLGVLPLSPSLFYFLGLLARKTNKISKLQINFGFYLLEVSSHKYHLES